MKTAYNRRKTNRATPAVAAVSAALLAAALTACEDTEPDPVPNGPVGDVTAGDVADETRDAMNTAGEFTAQTIDNWRAGMRDELAELDRDIQRLEARAAQLTGEAQAEAREAANDLRAMRDDFVRRVDEASADTAAAWRDVRTGLERGWDELTIAANRALERFDQP